MVHLLLSVIALAIFSCADAYPHSSRQLLPPKPGYVPVYIRNGDTPLEEINLELAEAFHAIPSGRSAGRKNIMAQRSHDEEEVVSKVKEEPKQEEKKQPVGEIVEGKSNSIQSDEQSNLLAKNEDSQSKSLNDKNVEESQHKEKASKTDKQ